MIAALDSELGGDGVVVPPGRAVPPHRGAHRPAGPRPSARRHTTCPTSRRSGRPGPAAPKLQPLMDASRDGSSAFDLAANQVWLWGQGFQPEMPSFADALRLRRRPVHRRRSRPRPRRADGHGRRRRRAARPAGYDTNYEGKRDAALDALADRCGPVPDPCRGHRRGRSRRQRRREDQGPRELGPRASSPVWSTGLDALGPWRLLLLPDHPTPVRLKTHTSDSVPYLLFDSRVEGPGGVYSEPATAGAVAVPGHQLIGRLVTNGC